MAKAKALILGLLASVATTAATLDLTIPPGDYMLVPIEPYQIITIQEPPVEPPIEPPVEPPIEPPVEPPVGAVGVINAIATIAPEQHETEIRFARIPESEAPVSLYPSDEEFPEFCPSISCRKSQGAFTAFSGGAWDSKDFEYINPPGGGHSGTGAAYIASAKLAVIDGQLGVDWKRLKDPVPLTDGSCGPPVDGTAPAQHLYSGPVYVKSRDEVFFPSAMGYGLVSSTCPQETKDKFANNQGGWLIKHKDDGDLEYRKVFGSERLISYPRCAYMENLDKIICNGTTMIDPADGYSWKTIPRPSGYDGFWSTAGNFDVAADPSKSRFYTYVRSRGIIGIEYQADGSSDVVWESNTKYFEDFGGVSALEVDPLTKDLVLVWTDGKAMYIDVETRDEVNISATSGEVIPSVAPNSIYGKMTMLPSLACRGLVLNDSADGIYIFTLPSNVCTISVDATVVEVPDQAEVGLIDAKIDPHYVPSQMTFAEKCDLPNVVFCDPLNDEAPVKKVNGVTTELTNPDGSRGLLFSNWWRKWRGGSSNGIDALAEFDPVENALRITKRDNADTAGGHFMTHFSDIAGENAFREGDTFSVEFQVKLDCEMVFSDCDPDGLTYKNDRIGYYNKNGNMQPHKIAILTEGNYAHGFDGYPATACRKTQHVVMNNYGTLASYNDCGSYIPHAIRVGSAGGSAQYERQTGKDFSCFRFPTPLTKDPGDTNYKQMTWNYTGPNCAMVPADEWITLKMHISIGEYDSSNNLFQLFVAYEGEPFKEVAHWNSFIRNPEGEVTPYPAFGSIHFTIHSTGSVANAGQPDKVAWYRDLIVKQVL